ncbi:chloride channel CLIC-like protein 1 isoform X2 [Pseudophryne corroboree]|uniref:chloride channel CLIC-like protein 1 isoform X2 n=1 Tax=Pseudophryne corroboree TaxID=495146 RepID=UPI003081F509
MSGLQLRALFTATTSVFAQVCKMDMLLLLSFCLFQCNGMHQEDDWIDPTDMLNYDAATGRMKNRPQYNIEEIAVKEAIREPEESSCLAENKECTINVDNLKREIEECRNAENLKLPPSNSDPVFRRYLYKILNGAERVSLPDNTQPEVHYDAEVVLTKEMLTEIQKFLDNADWNVGALDEALSKTLVRFKHHNEEEWRWRFEDYFGVDIFTAFMISLCILCVVSVIATEMWTHVEWFTQIKRLCFLSFIISIGWNWMYLYKLAFVERQAEVAKMGMFDKTCGEKMSWTESLLEWFKASSSFQNDPCEEYFKSVMIHPILMVPPTKALALTFTDFITEPLKHVGKAIGEFLHNLLAEIPLFYQMPVLLIIVLIVLVTCYGGSTSIGQWRNSRETPGDRLPIGYQQPPIYLQVDVRNQQPYREQLTHQPEYVERDRDPSYRRPEVLRALDCVDDKNHQNQLSSFAGMTSTLGGDYSGEQQRKDDTLHTKLFEQKQNESLQKESIVQQERKDQTGEDNMPEELKKKNSATVEKSVMQQKDENREEESFGSQDNKEEPIPKSVDLAITPVPNNNEQNYNATQTELKLINTDIETMKSMEPQSEEHVSGKAAEGK